MSIEHHPGEEMLAAYAAGALDLGQHVAVATHLTSCAHCHDWARSLERVGGALLAEAAPTALSDGALDRTLARLDEPTQPIAATASAVEDLPPGLPQFVKHYPFGAWRWVAPRVSLRPILLPEPGPTRVFLLKSAPNTGLLPHAHSGVEMTCVLSGAFSHDGERYGPGDFDFGDEGVHHEPRVEAGEDCVCLVAMQGDLRWSGPIGWLAHLFVRV
jgi:putative transcriptional regulator